MARGQREWSYNVHPLLIESQGEVTEFNIPVGVWMKFENLWNLHIGS